MKGRPKPYRSRKPYCRKKGGGAFQFKGGRKSPRATANFLGQNQNPLGLVASMLQKMGFRVGNR